MSRSSVKQALVWKSSYFLYNFVANWKATISFFYDLAKHDTFKLDEIFGLVCLPSCRVPLKQLIKVNISQNASQRDSKLREYHYCSTNVRHVWAPSWATVSHYARYICACVESRGLATCRSLRKFRAHCNKFQ